MKTLETLFQVSLENDNTKSRPFPSYGCVRSWKSNSEIKEWNFFFCFHLHLIELKEWVLKTYSELLAFSAYLPESLDVMSPVFSACCASFVSGKTPHFCSAKHSHRDTLIYLPRINEIFSILERKYCSLWMWWVTGKHLVCADRHTHLLTLQI